MFPGIQSPFIIEISETAKPMEDIAESVLLQSEFSNKERATIESLISIFRTLAFSIFGVLMGLLADSYGLVNTLIFATLLQTILIPIFYKTLKDKPAVVIKEKDIIC